MPDVNPLVTHFRDTALAVAAELKRHPKVVGIAVCGSLVRGDIWEHSDLDMLAVMREPEADWHVVTVKHGDVDVHLQVLSEDFLLWKGEGFRGGVVSQLLTLSEVVYDPEGIVEQGVRSFAAYPRASQVQNMVKHLVAFLSEYNRGRKCMETGFTEDAYLHVNVAFRELARAEYARCGVYPQRTLVDELVNVSPGTYKAYVWLVFGRNRVGEKVRRSFAFFERALQAILVDIGPALMAAVRARGGPLTEEEMGGIPAIYDRSADLRLLLERLVDQRIVREDRRTPSIEGIPLTTLSETLFGLF